MENKIIYKVVNVQTGEVYIGATSKTLEVRKEDHLQKANKKVGSYFQEAIGTYGSDAFSWEQIDTASNNDELASKEIKYILEYNTLENGYNSLNDTFEDLTSASNTIGVRKQDISRACWSVNHILEGYLWSYDYQEPFIIEPDNRKKQVIQYSLEGNVLAHYNSVADASKVSGISKTCISRCCRGEREHTGGFIWRYS